MAHKKKNGNTVDLVWKLAEPIAEQLGLSIWDIRFVKEGADWFLRIFIDKPEGIGIEDCENMSRAINEPLDRLDPIDQSYCLEVSSPGINRELTRDAHFEAYLDAEIYVKLIRPDESGRRELTGVLKAYQDGVIALQTEDGETLSLAKNSTAAVRLAEDDFVGGSLE